MIVDSLVILNPTIFGVNLHEAAQESVTHIIIQKVVIAKQELHRLSLTIFHLEMREKKQGVIFFCHEKSDV